jgi:hypothetical protein
MAAADLISVTLAPWRRTTLPPVGAHQNLLNVDRLPTLWRAERRLGAAD